MIPHASGVSGDDSVARELLFLLEVDDLFMDFCILCIPE